MDGSVFYLENKMRRKTWLTLSILILLGLGALMGAWDAQRAEAQVLETWVTATLLPGPMSGNLVRCADMPDSFYLVSGVEGLNITSDNLYQYNIGTGGWTVLASMPLGRRGTATACYEGKIYVAGGENVGIVDSLYIYDIGTGIWSSGAALPEAIAGAAMGAWEGKLYLAGGSRESAPFPPEDEVDVYDIASGVWTASGGEEMPTPASYAASTQIGSYLYMVGGYSGTLTQNVNQTQRYNMDTDQWAVGPSFTSARAFGTLVSTRGHLYMLGGDLNGGSIFDHTNLIDVLDLTSWPAGAWADAGFVLPAANIAPATTCSETLTVGEIWDVGGANNSWSTYRGVLYLPMGVSCTYHDHDLFVLPTSAEKLADPGETIEFELRVTNAGTSEDTYTIGLSGHTWVTSAPSATGEMEPDEIVVVTVRVTVPLDALPGEPDVVTVTFTSQGDPTVSATAILTSRSSYLIQMLPMVWKVGE